MLFPLILLWPFGLQLGLQVFADTFVPFDYGTVSDKANRVVPDENTNRAKQKTAPTGARDRCCTWPFGANKSYLPNRPKTMPKGRSDGGPVTHT